MPQEEDEHKPEKKDYYDKQIDKANKGKELHKKWKEEIASSEVLQNYFKDFEPRSVESFIDHFVSQKTDWIMYGDMLTDINEQEDLQWETAAFAQLKSIQQKKLFYKQCLWRAEKITLPDIEIGYDFEMWGNNILNCPFITPVSQSDIEEYAEFLLQSDVEVTDWFMDESWQDYVEIKEAYNEDKINTIPEWYEYHSDSLSLEVMMTMPDIRGEKEERYREIYRKSKKDTVVAPDATSDTKPQLREFDEGFMEKFVEKFESKEVQALYKVYTWSGRNSGWREQVEQYMDLLLTAEEDVPIEANKNWIDGLALAVQKYSRKKTVEALPLAYERYRINIDTGISFAGPDDPRDDIRKIFFDAIMKGRELNGEPGDVNF